MDRLVLETKFTLADETGAIEGIAWPFGSADRVGDIIEKGAFTGSPGRLPMLFAHDQAEAVGVWDSITEAADGLHVKGRLLVNDVARAKEVHALVREGAVTGLSIGFQTKSASPRKGGGRTIKALDLLEVSVVPVPAHPGARVLSLKEHTLPTTTTTTELPAELTSQLAATTKSLETLTGRLDKIEAKANRPGAGDTKVEPDAETKAFDIYVRRGAVAPEELKALSAGSDPNGGYLVPPTFVAELLKNIVQFSPVRQYARITSISSADITLPKRTGNMTAVWVGETDDRTGTNPTYGQIALTPFEAACYVDASNQLLEDSAINIASEISVDGAEEFGRLEGAAFVTGDGVGKPKGILAETSIETLITGNAATLGTNPADLLIDLYYKLPAFYRANAVWGMNTATIASIRKLKDGNGQYIWQPGLQAGEPDRLLGNPVAELPDMPAVGAGALPILFGDLRQAYRIIDRVQLGLLRDPYTLATKGQTRFHLRRRVGGGIVKAEAIKLIKVAAT